MQSGYRQIQRGDLPRKIEFWTNGSDIKIVLNHSCTISNMQENNAAFEAWALLLKSEGYKNIELSEKDTNMPLSLKDQLHYNRFIYRAINFKKAFSWFSLDNTLQTKLDSFSEEILSHANLYVNAPIMPYKTESDLHEAKIERMLIHDDKREKLNRLLNVNVKKYFLQLPASLLIGDVVEGREVFPRGAARIDLWGLDGSTFNLIELKVGSNKDLGVISQAFFYTCFMHEMYCVKRLEQKDPKGIRKYYEGKSERGYLNLVNANINFINTHFLLENKHKYFAAAFNEMRKCSFEGVNFNCAMFSSDSFNP